MRHTSLKKNQVGGVQSTPHVPLRDIIAFVPVMNETIKPYMAAKGHLPEEVEKNAPGLVQVAAVANFAVDGPLHQIGAERMVIQRF